LEKSTLPLNTYDQTTLLFHELLLHKFNPCPALTSPPEVIDDSGPRIRTLNKRMDRSTFLRWTRRGVGGDDTFGEHLVSCEENKI
jgi:hypothetical protein